MCPLTRSMRWRSREGQQLLFFADIAEVEEVMKERLTTPGKAFVIYHPSLSLFAKEFGLTQLVVEEHGNEPTARHLARLIVQAKELGVEAVFIQEEFETRSVMNIAKELV